MMEGVLPKATQPLISVLTLFSINTLAIICSGSDKIRFPNWFMV